MLPPYDMDAFLIEAELLLDWYLTAAGVKVTERLRAEFTRAVARRSCSRRSRRRRPGCCATIIRPICCGCRERDNVARIGAARFPGRHDGAPRLRPRVAAAGRARRRAGTARGRAVQPLRRAEGFTIQRFDAAGFAQVYATLAAQRATKILGIFARLDRRDGKPQYLRHIPRLLRYLNRSLAHPDLAPLKAWYAANLPPLGAL